ncbi:hypothetical protein L2E82_50402 [Cichorium intybus]|nr:hypothetical protein L2E82_50402 [Cichorium intybus]
MPLLTSSKKTHSFFRLLVSFFPVFPPSLLPVDLLLSFFLPSDTIHQRQPSPSHTPVAVAHVQIGVVIASYTDRSSPAPPDERCRCSSSLFLPSRHHQFNPPASQLPPVPSTTAASSDSLFASLDSINDAAEFLYVLYGKCMEFSRPGVATNGAKKNEMHQELELLFLAF